ncbi:MAG: HDIG domain-containing protein [Candidatus Aminicenantes bacterium]|nr:HDIG domain-containing protein [Candidatus Aminicenantes bacterium]
MSFLNFKKINFFKKTAPSTKQNNNNTAVKKYKENSWKQFLHNPFLYLTVFTMIIAYFISYLPATQSLPSLSPGEIAPSDIVTPRDLTYEDKETTETRRSEAESSVLPVYRFDQNVFLDAEKKIKDFFNTGRNWIDLPEQEKNFDEFKEFITATYRIGLSSSELQTMIRLEFSPVFEEVLINLVGMISSEGIILTKNFFIRGEQEKGLNLLRGPNTERSLKVEDILDVEEAKQRLSEEIDRLELSQGEKSLLKKLASLFLTQNITYDLTETEKRRSIERERIEKVYKTIKKGKVIVRKGDEVTTENIKLINIINENFKGKPTWLINFLGTFLLFGLLMLAVWYYLKSLLKPSKGFRAYLMMGLLLILGLLIYKLSIFLAETFSQSSNFFLLKYTESYYRAFPFQFGTLLFAFLTNIQVALTFSILNSFLIGYLFKSNFYLMAFSLIAGFAAIYGIKHYGKKNLTSLFRTGMFLIGPVNVFIILTFHLIREKIGPVDLIASEIIMGVVGGILSASLAFLLLPVMENLFNFVTQNKLMEITSSDHPIFRQMAIKAPGTYHHSLLVAMLVEKAADELKIDTMLAKAGALYHDIGKIKRPEYFSENKSRNLDIHRDLKPSMSSLVIVNHVKEGVEQAKKLKLPKKIIDIIEQHHGNSLIRYFFEKAKEEYDPEMQKIGEESYRYSGPKPQSKEAALVMLADSVEAASRTLKSPTRQNFKRVISEIFNNYLDDGQLDDCDLSLHELRTVADSFLDTLFNIYHQRIEYPGFNFEIPKKNNTDRKKTTNDRNNKQTKVLLDQ